MNSSIKLSPLPHPQTQRPQPPPTPPTTTRHQQRHDPRRDRLRTTTQRSAWRDHLHIKRSPTQNQSLRQIYRHPQRLASHLFTRPANPANPHHLLELRQQTQSQKINPCKTPKTSEPSPNCSNKPKP